MLKADTRLGRRDSTCRRFPRGAIAGSVLAFWLAISSVGSGAATASDPVLERLARQFEDVAFGHEHGPARDRVYKWTENPAIAFFAQREHVVPYLPLIRRHIGTIRAVAGVAPVPAKPEDATLRFGFSPRAAFARLPRMSSSNDYDAFFATSACVALAIGDPEHKGRIVAGAIAIGVDIPESQSRHCILEELVQVLGLPNDACHYRPSLFCEHDRVFELTGPDAILLRTLYDERLEVGMIRAEAMPIVRRIIAETLLQAHPTGTGLPLARIGPVPSLP
jgi:hypothetical protein